MRKRGSIFAIGIISTISTVLGFFFSPPGAPLGIAVGNRLLGVLLIWVTLVFCLQRNRVESLLRKNEARLQLQVRRMPIGCIVWTPDFRVLSCNPAAEQIFGFTEGEALGKHPYDLIVPKSAQPHVDAIWQRLSKGDFTAHSVNENVTKDGRTIICQWSNTPLKEPDGRAIGALSMVHDITERKRLEVERSWWASIVECSTDAILGTTMEGAVVSWNAGAERMYGYSAAEMKGRPISILYPPDRAGEFSQFLETLKRGERITDYETVRVGKDGRQIPVSTTISVVRDGRGKMVGLSSIARHILEPPLPSRKTEDTATTREEAAWH